MMAAEIDTHLPKGAGSIPIRNLYYLLCYAWDYLRQGLPVPMPSGEFENLADLFALILARGVRHEVRRGIHREYLEYAKETPRIRGRMEISESMGRQTWRNGRMVCRFDELTHDVLPNRILRATGESLLREPGLSKGNRMLLREALKWFADVTPIQVSAGHLRQLEVPRRKRSYRFLLNVCELYYRLRLPGETGADGGDRLMREILRDEMRLCDLFEAFVRNFYVQHLRGSQVASCYVRWDGLGLDEESQRHLPELQTDVLIEGSETRLIIDCKFYQNALSGGRYDDKVMGAHLFQLLAYLQNARKTRPGWSAGRISEGILLYPVVRRTFDFRYRLLDHRIRVATVDLGVPWQQIHERLLALVASEPAD